MIIGQSHLYIKQRGRDLKRHHQHESYRVSLTITGSDLQMGNVVRQRYRLMLHSGVVIDVHARPSVQSIHESR